jgi:type IV secretory pathway VirB6-like protein
MQQIKNNKLSRILHFVTLLSLALILSNCNKTCWFKEDIENNGTSTISAVNPPILFSATDNSAINIGTATNRANSPVPDELEVAYITGLISFNTFMNPPTSNNISLSNNILLYSKNNQCTVAQNSITTGFIYSGTIASMLATYKGITISDLTNKTFFGTKLYYGSDSYFAKTITLGGFEASNNNFFSFSSNKKNNDCQGSTYLVPKPIKGESFSFGSSFVEGHNDPKVSFTYSISNVIKKNKVLTMGSTINNSFSKPQNKTTRQIYPSEDISAILQITDSNQNNVMGGFSLQTKTILTNKSPISKAIKNFSQTITTMAKRTSDIIFDNLVRNLNTVISAMLSIYISISGIAYLGGLAQMTQKDFLTKAIKIGIVILVMQSGNVTIFNEDSGNSSPLYIYFMSFFINALKSIFSFIADHDITNTADEVTVFVDPLIESVKIFLTSAVWTKLLFGIVTMLGLFLFFYCVIIIFTYTIITLKVIVSFLVCIIMMYLLFSLAPIFISFILFEKTKSFFESWVKLLLSLTLQPIFVVIAFYILNDLIINQLLFLLNDPICWEATNIPIALNLNLIIPELSSLTRFIPFNIIDLIDKIPLGNLYWFQYENQAAFISSCIIIFIYIKSMGSIIDFCAILAEKITLGTMYSGNIMGSSTADKFDPGLSKGFDKISNKASKSFNEAFDKEQGRR